MNSDAWQWEKVESDYWLKPDGLVINFGFDLLRMDKQLVYDLGCGLGRHLLFLTELGLKVSGSDSSLYAVERLNKILESKKVTQRVECKKMTDVKEEDNTYDAVIAFHTIYHNTYQDMVKVIHLIWKMLKPDGKVLLSFLVDPDLSKDIGNREFAKDEEPEKGVPHVAINKEIIPGLLSQFTINQLWYIEHHYKNLTHSGFHCFVEATAKK